MSELLYGHDKLVTKWVIDRVDSLHRLECCVAIGVSSGSKLIAGVVYHDYQPEARIIQMSMAAISPMWAKKEIIWKLLQYPYDQLDCFKILLSISVDNIKALKTMKHIGFVQEAILNHNYGKDKHAVILGMLKPDYQRKFLNYG